MKTKAAKKTPPPAAEPEAPIREESTSTENESKKKRFTISFDLAEDGSPDVASMQERTKAKVIEFFSNPKIAAQLGVKDSAKPAEVMMFTPSMVSGFYDLLGSVEAMIAQKFGGIPAPIAKQAFTYTQIEKELLSEPTVKIINKYMPLWLLKYQDEIALAMILGSLTVAKVNAAIMLSKVKQAEVVEIPKKEPEGAGSQPN